MDPTDYYQSAVLNEWLLLSQYQKEIDLNARAQDVIDRKKRKRRERDGKGRDGNGKDRRRDKGDNKQNLLPNQATTPRVKSIGSKT